MPSSEFLPHNTAYPKEINGTETVKNQLQGSDLNSCSEEKRFRMQERR